MLLGITNLKDKSDYRDFCLACYRSYEKYRLIVSNRTKNHKSMKFYLNIYKFGIVHF